LRDGERLGGWAPARCQLLLLLRLAVGTRSAATT